MVLAGTFSRCWPLSLALQSAGHQVLLAGPPEKEAWAREVGCPFCPLGRNITAFIDTMKDAHSIRSAIHFIRYLHEEFIYQFQALPKIIAGADLVVGASLVPPLASVAESMAIPYRFVLFCPSLLPSGEYPSPFIRRQNLPKALNRASWLMGAMLDRLMLTPTLNKGRKDLGLPPVRNAWFKTLGGCVVVASDAALSSVPRDVGVDFIQTGYLHLEQPDQCCEGLEAFLNAGPPPIYAGFGSMPRQQQMDMVSILVKAVRSAGTRVVIAKFWDEPSQFSQSEDVFFISRYPHLKLFPRMAGIIHHGGAGTTAAAAASGAPQFVLPHLLDQYYWGQQVYRLNLGPRPI